MQLGDSLNKSHSTKSSPLIWVAVGIVILVVLLLWVILQQRDQSQAKVTESDSAADSSAVEPTGSEFAPSSPLSTGPSSTEQSNTTRSTSAKEALRHAREMSQLATALSERGKHGEAAETAIKAWELASHYPDDPDCQKLADEIGGTLSELAARSNKSSGNSTSSPGKTLIAN